MIYSCLFPFSPLFLLVVFKTSLNEIYFIYNLKTNFLKSILCGMLLQKIIRRRSLWQGFFFLNEKGAFSVKFATIFFKFKRDKYFLWIKKQLHFSNNFSIFTKGLNFEWCRRHNVWYKYKEKEWIMAKKSFQTTFQLLFFHFCLMTVKFLFFGSNINKIEDGEKRREDESRDWEGSGQTRAQLWQ